MKKEYISPEAIAIKIETMGMLAVSGFDEVVDTTTPIDAGDMLAPEDNYDFSEFEDDYDFDE